MIKIQKEAFIYNLTLEFDELRNGRSKADLSTMIDCMIKLYCKAYQYHTKGPYLIDDCDTEIIRKELKALLLKTNKYTKSR